MRVVQSGLGFIPAEAAADSSAMDFIPAPAVENMVWLYLS